MTVWVLGLKALNSTIPTIGANNPPVPVQLPLTVILRLLLLIAPFELVKSPVTDRSLEFKVNVPSPEWIKLKNLLPEPAVRLWAAVPSKVTVPLEGMNIPPVPVQLPPMVILRLLLSRVPKEELVRLPLMERLLPVSCSVPAAL